MVISRTFSPHTLTILCTYQCTAACKQCCFESSPSVKGRLSRATIIARIAEAKRSFPNLQVVVFSGGEAFMLKDDLFASIAYATSEGLMTRVVSNGYWGRTEKAAASTVAKIKAAGLSELNISTGKDHQVWVPVASVINAATAAADSGIFTLITVESEGDDRKLINEVLRHPRMAPYLESRAISVQSNSWMPFHQGAEDRRQTVDQSELRNGCDQIFGTVVVTPHDNLSACCGLTLEHIPEMRLGKNSGNNMDELFASQFDDFMKMWIRVDGPYSIIERVMGDEAAEYLDRAVHICEACSLMHKDPSIRAQLKTRYQEFVPEILTRFKVSMALHERSLPRTTST